MAASRLIAGAGEKKRWAFYGEMGVGKTTLIKEICHIKGVRDLISSPTFSLVNEYRTAGDETILHVDFYRIKSLEEVYDIGYEDYFYSGHLCLIEWPEKIAELLKEDEFIEIHLTKEDELSRTLRWKAAG